jgi:hypothetical protein
MNHSLSYKIHSFPVFIIFDPAPTPAVYKDLHGCDISQNPNNGALPRVSLVFEMRGSEEKVLHYELHVVNCRFEAGMEK